MQGPSGPGPGLDQDQTDIHRPTVHGSPGPGPKNCVRDGSVGSPVQQKWPGTRPDRTSPTLVPIELEQPIGLQLACVDSNSTINYGAKSTIMFGTTCVKEYFNIANIDYYNVILGTPFLRRLNIILDFTSPGAIHMGTTMGPRNLPPETSEGFTRVADCRSLLCKPPE